MTISRFLLATALYGGFATSTYAEPQGAKNVILMVADGIGFNGWLAADYYQGRAGAQSYQVTRPDGTEPVFFGMDHHALNLIDTEGRFLPYRANDANTVGAVAQGYAPTTRWLAFEAAIRNDFPPVEKRYTSYTDSAAAATAMMTGRKTSNGRINMNWSGAVSFTTIAEIAMDQGKSAGSVMSVQVANTTGAATIAHNRSRYNLIEIFKEMVSSDLDVIMGAGHPYFDDSGNATEPKDDEAYRYIGGSETMAALTRDGGLNGFAFIDAKSDFEALAAGDDLPGRVVGVAQARSTLQAMRENLGASDTPSGMAKNPLTPDLATMSLGAINVLNQDEAGFFLLVEGGAVDWMGHRNNMPRYIEEQIDFNRAVDAVIAWVERTSNWEETLLIVTSDHETGGIWGEGTWINSEGGPVAADRSDDAVLAARYDPTTDVFVDFRAVQDRGPGQMPGYMFSSRNHTNDLVPLWALGVGSSLFAEFTRTDLGAAQLWGEPFNWNGAYIDNTTVFTVMNAALAAGAARTERPEH